MKYVGTTLIAISVLLSCLFYISCASSSHVYTTETQRFYEDEQLISMKESRYCDGKLAVDTDIMPGIQKLAEKTNIQIPASGFSITTIRRNGKEIQKFDSSKNNKVHDERLFVDIETVEVKYEPASSEISRAFLISGEVAVVGTGSFALSILYPFVDNAGACFIHPFREYLAQDSRSYLPINSIPDAKFHWEDANELKYNLKPHSAYSEYYKRFYKTDIAVTQTYAESITNEYTGKKEIHVIATNTFTNSYTPKDSYSWKYGWGVGVNRGITAGYTIGTPLGLASWLVCKVILFPFDALIHHASKPEE